MEQTVEQTCYRHPSRETGVSCSSCGRPICTDCMIPTPVGMRCPECAKQKTQVRTAASIYSYDPYATYVIIAINVVVFLAQVMTGGGGWNADTGTVYREGVLFGPWIYDGEWWRVLTAGFLHGDPIHLAFNMLGAFFLGQMLEPALGKARFVALYLAALLVGSFGAFLQNPGGGTVGASGAVFGLFGAAFIIMRRQGIDPMRSFIGPILLINILLSFRPGVSWGGHLGGLAAGGLCALILSSTEDGTRRGQILGVVGCALVGVAGFAATVWASGQPSFYD